MSTALTHPETEVAVTMASALRNDRDGSQAGVGLVVSTAEIRREESSASLSHSCGSSQDGPLSSVPNVVFSR
jgi:hypothetical protein